MRARALDLAGGVGAKIAAAGPGARAHALDLAVAVLATITELSLLYDDASEPSLRGISLTVLAGAALLARRRAPLAVLAFTLACGVTLAALGDSPGGAPVLVALFTVADTCDRRVAFAAVVPTAVILEVASINSPPVSVIACLLGAYWQARRRSAEEQARNVIHEERAAIARELHDIVAHSVSVMLVGVRGARDVLRSDPDVADHTLARVEASGEESLAELRRILALLREPERVADLRPQPSLADLRALVDDYRAAGLPVELRVTGEQRPLPGGVELSVYRIVQEALTNALRHAHATSVTVALRYGERLDVEVIDDGAAGTTGTGHGLTGMRERVALLGGELEAGHATGGGFRVAARLPL
ncbi:histidine kinase [Conexibacter stalactiti]|uniref:histidine kinase n=1 Tax=Conexibacter stalactiti TaxID=1940611 RepID=A0ABU4HQC6_9ACTN|nr:histidine kinase [Conexibacter stalactiti]MDW5595434.1 histidine kinase [Conexibacter stalactiti]MEC5036076.1 histidine kinase [Conexibacter stalactiti]